MLPKGDPVQLFKLVHGVSFQVTFHARMLPDGSHSCKRRRIDGRLTALRNCC